MSYPSVCLALPISDLHVTACVCLVLRIQGSRTSVDFSPSHKALGRTLWACGEVYKVTPVQWHFVEVIPSCLVYQLVRLCQGFRLLAKGNAGPEHLLGFQVSGYQPMSREKAAELLRPHLLGAILLIKRPDWELEIAVTAPRPW